MEVSTSSSKSSTSVGNPIMAERYFKLPLPRLNTADLDIYSTKRRTKTPADPKTYRISKVHNDVAEDLQLSKFLDENPDQISSEEQDLESQQRTTDNENFVEVSEELFEVLSDFGSVSMNEEKSSVGEFDWTLLDDANDCVYAAEHESDLVVLKSSKSYLLALTSNIGSATAAKPVKHTYQVQRSQRNQRKEPLPAHVKAATVHIQSNIPEEYYIRKSKPHRLHGKALKMRKGVN